MRKLLCLKLLPLISLVLQLPATTWAQSYPNKPIRFIVASSPGSSADLLVRVVAPQLGMELGQQIVVENRTGAGTTIGTAYAAKAPPDGYTLLNVNMAATANETLRPNRGYILMRDFAPVTQMVTSASILVAHPSFPSRTIRELVRLAKAKPHYVNYGHAGVGSGTFLAGELFKKIANVRIVAVPYRGGGEAVTAVLSGEVPIYFAPAGSVLPHIQRKALRAIAVLNQRRLSTLPLVPTIAESGYPDYKCDNWYGMLVPIGTPREIIATLHKATLSALRNRQVLHSFEASGFAPATSNSPDEFAALINSQIKTWGEVVRQTGIVIK